MMHVHKILTTQPPCAPSATAGSPHRAPCLVAGHGTPTDPPSIPWNRRSLIGRVVATAKGDSDMPEVLEPHDADECEAVTAQLCDLALHALACDELEKVESYILAIRARNATLMADARRFWKGGRS